MTFWCLEFTPQKFINVSWGLNLSGRDAQGRNGDGFCRKQKFSLALEELFATPGPTFSDFSRDWCFQHIETLQGKNILCASVCSASQDFTILFAEQTHFLCAYSTGSLLSGRLKHKIRVQISIAPTSVDTWGLTCELTLLWLLGKLSFYGKTDLLP